MPHGQGSPPGGDEYAEELPEFAWNEEGGPLHGRNTVEYRKRPTEPFVLTIPTLQSGQFHNLDDVMLHAAFAVLRQFLESEFPGPAAWRTADLRELEELYRWWERTWMIERPTSANEYEQDDEMLVRLVRIRHILWT